MSITRKTYEDFGIEIKTGSRRGQYVTVCPKCSSDRRKKTDKCLSINLTKEVWHCHHCQWKGGLPKENENHVVFEKIDYKKPEWKNKTSLSENVVKWFEERKISQTTLNKMKISEGLEWMPQKQKEVNTIQFNYFYEDVLINIKFRDGAKNFKLSKDAEKIFYNLDCVKNSNRIYIVEGEIDVLSFVECGFNNCISVPNGSNSNLDECLNNYIELFTDKEIIIAVDNDKPGRELKQKLVSRFGVENCKFIDYKDCKDGNDYLVKYGSIEFTTLVNNLLDFPMEGVFTINDISDDIDDMFFNGLDRGIDLGIDGFNLRIVKGYLTVITGIPSHGKSDWLDNMILHATINHGWKGALYSPENKPTQLHFSKLARKIIGKHWDTNRFTKGMNIEEVKMVKEFLNNKMFFIKPEKDFTLDSILSSALQVQKKHGLDYIVIDAWNKLGNRETDTDAIGNTLDKLALHLERNNIHCFLVVHPAKMMKKENGTYTVPTLYDCKGSSTFYDKADNGITVYRDFGLEQSHIYVTKIKFDHWGEVTKSPSVYKYHIDSKRYYIEEKGVDTKCWIKESEQIAIDFTPKNDIAKNVLINDADFLDSEGYSKLTDEMPF